MICVECEADFDHRSPVRRRAGGKINVCLDCADEPVVRYAGVAAGEGKMSAVQILRFDSPEDRKEYLDYWKVNSGLYKGKSCQIGRGLKSSTGVKFQTVATYNPNANAKGKA
jgi:hypothetical protein